MYKIEANVFRKKYVLYIWAVGKWYAHTHTKADILK